MAHFLPREMHHRVGDRVTIQEGEAIPSHTIANKIKQMLIRFEERRDGRVTCHNNRARVCGIRIGPSDEVISLGRLSRQRNFIAMSHRVHEILHNTAMRHRTDRNDVRPLRPLRLDGHIRSTDHSRERRRPASKRVTLLRERDIQHRVHYRVTISDHYRIQGDAIGYHIKFILIRSEGSADGSIARHHQRIRIRR